MSKTNNPDIIVNNTEAGEYVDSSYSQESLDELSEKNRKKWEEEYLENLKKPTKGGRKKSLRKTNRKRKTRRRRTNRRR